MVVQETTWTGTMTMLKAHLVGRITDDDKNQRAWKELKPSNLGKELRRIQPNLRQEGIMIELNSGGKRREVTISLGDSGDSGDGKSSAPTPQPQLTDWGNSYRDIQLYMEVSRQNGGTNGGTNPPE